MNTQNHSKRRRKIIILVDSTDLQVDLNGIERKDLRSLEDEEFKWGCSSSKGLYYISTTITLEYLKMKSWPYYLSGILLMILQFSHKIMEQLKNRSLILKEDTFIFNKGYYS
ncbi:hypothetical protein [Methanobacterium sp.]|uniref:hypothetical protein n=1 Tax=Methanobacterium sp. TaxID=2164 RepID=UPI002AB83AD8|nr:hypothetical protein [Methanobacterium sp.]MDY9924376.1 hypothetical protein [Methanobacterium sp.]